MVKREKKGRVASVELKESHDGNGRTMPDSPRRMMEKVLEFKTPLVEQKRFAKYALTREDWIELLHGSHQQAYFRDFILNLIKYGEQYEVDDTEVPRMIRGLMNSGYLWRYFNRIKQQDLMARLIMISFSSIQWSSFDCTEDNFITVLEVVSDKPTYVLALAAEDAEFRLHPMIVEKILSSPEVAQKITILLRSGITDPHLALSLVDDDIVAPLFSGAL